MILIRYLLSRLFLNIFSINIGLTLLFNFIEFFEKMVRVEQTNAATILYFIALNIVPSFFENLSTAAWLGSCLTLKELYQQNEWETLQLLNVSLKKVIFLVLVAGTTLTVFSFFGKEFLTHTLAQSTEEFKLKQFKHNKHQKLFNQWFVLKKTCAVPRANRYFCYFGFLNLQENKGSNFSLLELSKDFKIKKITSAKHFLIFPKTKEITMSNGIEILTETKKQALLREKKFFLPGFFTQLQMRGTSLSLKQLFQAVILDSHTLPPSTYNQILYIFLSRVLEHLLLLLYPLLTFILFFTFPYHRLYRWILIFLPYPVATLLFTAADSAMQFFQNGLFAIVPYVILILTTLLGYNAIRK